MAYKISKQKLALIHVGKKKLQWTEKVYRHVLRDYGGVESAKDLDEAGAKRVIDHMKAMGFWIKRNFEQGRPRNAGEMTTVPQQQVIDQLWKDLCEYVPAAHMRNFRQRVVKRPGRKPEPRSQRRHRGAQTARPTRNGSACQARLRIKK